MAAYVITGDESLVSLELTTLVDTLVGDNDRSFMVDEFDCSDKRTLMGNIADALTMMPMFTERRVVVVRNLHDIKDEGEPNDDPITVQRLADAIDARIDEVDLVLTVTGRQPKAIADVMKKAGAETIGTAVGTGWKDKLEFVETHLAEAGLQWTPDVPQLLANWLGGDQSRLAGLLKTLVATYGEEARLTRSDVEVFLGTAGKVAPWDLTDAIDNGNTPKALVMLHRFLGDGDTHPLQVLALLGNRYAQMMKLDGRNVRSGADAVAILGGKEFAAKKVLEQYQRLGGGGVARAVSHIATADVDLRGGKDWPPELVMEVLVGRLCQLVPGGGARRQPSRR